ncbi:MAG TPA: alpha-1,2-fucosyltransferase, partial [Bacteroidia bacterium]|nr:alpha-1,2-fucosyltransferase [Bacteroidia bacterium]
MILVRLMGGLGNQMFQFALGYNLARKNNTELKIDTSLLADKSQPHEVVTHRDLEIDIFDIPLSFATQKEVEYFNGKSYSSIPGKIGNKVAWQFRKKNLIIENGRNFHPEILTLPDNKCLVGSWQSEKYFKDIENEIRKLYSFTKPLTGKPLAISSEIKNSESVCIHVRRGDYVTSPIYSKSLGTTEPGYYMQALELLKSKRKVNNLFVFSDDIEWCKANLIFSIPTQYMDYEATGKKYAIDMQLMSLCKHFIIPNSTFGWWA